MQKRTAFKTVDDYIAASPDRVRPILRRIRSIVKKAAPIAVETISYGIPTYKLDGVILYFAAFKKHIGLYPPVKGDVRIERAAKPYAGPKGNLIFPLDKPIPYELIERIVKWRVKENRRAGGTHDTK